MTFPAANEEPLSAPMHYRSLVPLLTDSLFYASEAVAAEEKGKKYHESAAARACVASCAFAMEAAVNCVLKKFAPTDFEWRAKEGRPLSEKIPLASKWAVGKEIYISAKPIDRALKIYKLRNILAHPKDVRSGLIWHNPHENDPAKWEMDLKKPKVEGKPFASYVSGWGALEARKSVEALIAFLAYFFGEVLVLSPVAAAKMLGTNGEIGNLIYALETTDTKIILAQSLAVLGLSIDFIDLDEIGGEEYIP